MSHPSPGPGIADRFRSIVERLCGALARHAELDFTAVAFVQIIVGDLRRRLARFVTWQARRDAGLPPPPPPPRQTGANRADRVRAFSFMPRNRGWLHALAEHDGATAFWQLRDLLAEPEMAAFVAADRRVGRILRPLWWMLSPTCPLPDVLGPPPPAQAPAPDASAAPRAPSGERGSSPPLVRRVRAGGMAVPVLPVPV